MEDKEVPKNTGYWIRAGEVRGVRDKILKF